MSSEPSVMFIYFYFYSLACPYLDAMENFLDKEEKASEDEEKSDEKESEVLGYEDPGYAPEEYKNLLSAELGDDDSDWYVTCELI